MRMKSNWLLPALMLLTTLAACSTPSPVLQPVPVPQRKFKVDRDLLLPADRKAMVALDSYLSSLPMPIPSVLPMTIDSTPSLSK